MNPRFSLALVVLVLVGAALALYVSDGARLAAPATTPITQTAEAPTSSPAPAQAYVLAISWHPAFCEQKPNLPECRNQSSSDFEASSFVLHGLWPQDDEYCGVSRRLIDIDDSNRWGDLPDVELSSRTRAALARVMPGVEDNLHRHEWLVHGTCSGASAETYYSRSIALLESINGSAVRQLLAANIGREVSRNEIRAAFDAAFGKGAGRKVRLACNDDGDRALLSELRINLDGDVMGATDLADLIQTARAASAGCTGGVVDPVGRQ